MKKVSLPQSIAKFIEESSDYYKNWTFDNPIFITEQKNSDAQLLQKCMYKLIVEFVEHYDNYAHLMPVSDKEKYILDLCKQRTYVPGTYRTDFVYDKYGQEKIIEITCRFAFNGLFLSALMEGFAQEARKSLDIPNGSTPFDGVYDHLNQYLGEQKEVYILQGDDLRNSSKIYKDILVRTGIVVKEINYKSIKSSLADMANALIISELALEEITALDNDTLEQLTAMNVINDFRTVFLIHDKRFFSVLGDKKLQESALTKQEIRHFSKYYIPSYSATERPDLWMDAKLNKNNWIIKHRSLGKSQKVYAGVVTAPKEWERLFVETDLKDMVLQEWIPQNTVEMKMNGKVFNDYVTGTFLFFDDAYFGYGVFRTSSHPVTNKVDDRKAYGLVCSEADMEGVSKKEVAVLS